MIGTAEERADATQLLEQAGCIPTEHAVDLAIILAHDERPFTRPTDV